MPLDAERLAALGAEIRAHANVYRSAVALASMLELLTPYEEAEARARAGAETARAAEEKAGQAAEAAQRTMAAVLLERDRAVAKMHNDLEALERAQQADIDGRLALAKAELKRTDERQRDSSAQLRRVEERLAAVKELFK